MPHEIEIKLRIPPEALHGVARLAWLREMASGPAKRAKLVSVYFDTGKFKLRDRGVSLRLRRVGRKWVQTVKADGGGGAGAFGRSEWEHAVAADRPDFDAAKDTALDPLATGKLRRRIRPVFRTEIWRTAIPLRCGDSELELAVDRGQIVAGRRRRMVSEIEIELKRGDPVEIARLAGRIAQAVPVAYEPLTKPERGYALCAGTSSKPVHADPVVLRPDFTTAESLRVIGLECLRHLAANERAVRTGESEGVHQMRVGLRRLRAAISVFRELADDRETDAVKTELRWLTEQLAPARDFDVFVTESVAPLAGAHAGASEIALLRADMEQRRDAGFARAKAAVESRRYRRLVLDVALWLGNGRWSADPDPLREARRARPIVPFATEVLTRRSQKIVKQAAKLEKLDMHQRHRLRIGIKKLRYATEFFESLFAGAGQRARQKRLVETLKVLQDVLGQLNDMGVYQKLAGEIVERGKHPDRRPEKAFAMGMVAGRGQVKYEASVGAAMKASARLAAGRQFWQ